MSLKTKSCGTNQISTAILMKSTLAVLICPFVPTTNLMIVPHHLFPFPANRFQGALRRGLDWAWNARSSSFQVELPPIYVSCQKNKIKKRMINTNRTNECLCQRKSFPLSPFSHNSSSESPGCPYLYRASQTATSATSSSQGRKHQHITHVTALTKASWVVPIQPTE